MDPETKSFVIEQWAEYGAITLILWSRLAVRIRVQGVRRLDGDDYLSVLAFVSHCTTNTHIPYLDSYSQPIGMLIHSYSSLGHHHSHVICGPGRGGKRTQQGAPKRSCQTPNSHSNTRPGRVAGGWVQVVLSRLVYLSWICCKWLPLPKTLPFANLSGA